MGSAASLQCWEVGLIPSLAQWVKGSGTATAAVAWRRSQLWLRSDPWPGNSICHWAANRKKKKKNSKKKRNKSFLSCHGSSATVQDGFPLAARRTRWKKGNGSLSTGTFPCLAVPQSPIESISNKLQFGLICMFLLPELRMDYSQLERGGRVKQEEDNGDGSTEQSNPPPRQGRASRRPVLACVLPRLSNATSKAAGQGSWPLKLHSHPETYLNFKLIVNSLQDLSQKSTT